jgi:hypothetical protein
MGVVKKKQFRVRSRRHDRQTSCCTGRTGTTPGQTGPYAGKPGQNRLSGRCPQGQFPGALALSPGAQSGQTNHQAG